MPACYVNQARKSRLMEALNRRENAVTRNTNCVSVVQRMELPHRDNLTRLYIGYTRSSCTSINKWYTGHRVQAVHLTATRARSPASKGSLDRGQVVTNHAHPVRCVGFSHTLRRSRARRSDHLPLPPPFSFYPFSPPPLPPFPPR